MTLTEDTVLHRPPLSRQPKSRQPNDSAHVLIDPAAPRWVAAEAAGAALLEAFDGRRTLGEVARDYSAERRLPLVKAWQHVDTLAGDALRAGLLRREPLVTPRYDGRAPHVADLSLSELWLHTNDSCNLRCTHCLVSSGPSGDPGMPTAALLRVISEAREIGTRRFFVTGGEPFLRRDLLDLVDAMLEDEDAEVAILTNAMLLPGARLDALRTRDLARIRLQVSLDGATAATNDAIRGRGCFDKTTAGIRAAAAAGVDVTVSTVITESNASEVPIVTRLAASLGARRHHLLWLHKRGRADGSGPDRTPPVDRVIDVVREARAAAAECGIVLDNHEAVKARLRGTAGVKRDLSSACVTSLCVASDGGVYPSAAMAGVAELRCGSVRETPLARIWRESEVCRRFRETSVVQKPLCGACPLQFLCGGGDLEHAWFWGGSLDAHDPYCELHKAMFRDAFEEICAERARLHPGRRAGFDAPVLLAAMGEGGVDPASDEEAPRAVTVSRSECVLSYDLDAPRAIVRAFYGDAAEKPQAELCCPVRPDAKDLAHIPAEVVERFYGCGSPVARAEIQPGETTLDLGCGAGIDVFIAARRVGREGRAIGVDMTGRMLAVARDARPEVARRLGYDVVDFREGFLEAIPAADGSVDLVTSNCVVNLSPDKKRVFAEAWRVLRDHGRLVLSDIVADEEVPDHLRRNPRLWGECISGALTQEELVAFLERAGFFGIRILARTLWKEVEGRSFFSVTVRGEKFAKRAGCVFAGHRATYLGPFKGASDEEGHWFPRNAAIAVCTDTVAKLTRPPYAGSFLVVGPEGEVASLDGASLDVVSVDGNGHCDEAGCC